jgi:excisionase family DNA binding protein
MADLMTFRQCAAEAKTSESYWRKLVYRRRIRVVRVGRAIRVARDDFERFLRDGERPALHDAER